MRNKRIVFLLAVLLVIGIFADTVVQASEEALSVIGGEPVVYLCDNGDQLVAHYYMLSDESLRFVKVLFPDKTEYTLPQVLSASGARYTDDVELLWWIKGDGAYVEKRDEAGEWRPLYKECRAQP